MLHGTSIRKLRRREAQGPPTFGRAGIPLRGDEDLGSCIPLVREVAMGEPLAVGAPDGFGRYGAVAFGGRGLICHECGQAHRHLGLHVYRAHGLRAAEYRKRHGLARGRGLVADDLREVIQANAVARMNQVTGQGSFDPAIQQLPPGHAWRIGRVSHLRRSPSRRHEQRGWGVPPDAHW
jgi:hypothetical protein